MGLKRILIKLVAGSQNSCFDGKGQLVWYMQRKTSLSPHDCESEHLFLNQFWRIRTWTKIVCTHQSCSPAEFVVWQNYVLVAQLNSITDLSRVDSESAKYAGILLVQHTLSKTGLASVSEIYTFLRYLGLIDEFVCWKNLQEMTVC